MPDALTELERLAEADGATFLRSATGAWWARDNDGITIVRGAMSRAEAALLYCEDRDLISSTPEAILARIEAQYRPYDSVREFQEGFDAYQIDGAANFRRNPYDNGVAAQAWDRGLTPRCSTAARGELSARPGRHGAPRCPQGGRRDAAPRVAAQAGGEALTWSHSPQLR
jgi:hypothetical protein